MPDIANPRCGNTHRETSQLAELVLGSSRRFDYSHETHLAYDGEAVCISPKDKRTEIRSFDVKSSLSHRGHDPRAM